MLQRPEKYLKHKTLKTFGLSEAQLRDLLKTVSHGHDLHIRFVVNSPGVDIYISAESKIEKIADSLLASAEKSICNQIGDNIYAFDKETMEEVVGYLLYLKQYSLSIAENCTGGLLSNLISNITGCSFYYKGGITACDADAVSLLFNIPRESIERYGLVSERVTRDMARAVSSLTQSNFALSVTGVMGLEEGENVGMVWICLYSNGQITCRQFFFSGERYEMKLKAAYTAFDILRRELLD
ncbi:MAG: nicotinamide-nucleotide amidohydrolase family protein [bacterium]|nr:nicotinamide-nucleotide amidohydrolase family protein [bacterium]